MIQFTHILCPIDFSEWAARSLAHAAALARWYEAKLTLLHVAPTFDPIVVQGGLGDPVKVVNPMTEGDVVEQMRKTLDLDRVAPHAALAARAGDPAEVIVHEATTTGADLIVMGTQGRRGFKRLFLGSVAETVLRDSPCPVLTVPPLVPPAASDLVTFKRILCAIDFSASSLRSLEFALDLARQADGVVTLFHAVEWLPEDKLLATRFETGAYRQELIDDAGDKLRALVAEESRAWVDINNVVVEGRPYREMLRQAEAMSAELIAMGAQGRGGIDLALFGSTTQQVVRAASCPVLTVRASAA